MPSEYCWMFYSWHLQWSHAFIYIFYHWITNRVQVFMMTPWHGITLRIPVPLWDESISHQRYPLHRRLESSGCNHQPVQYVETAPVMRGAMILMGACVTSLKCVDIMAPIIYILGSLLLSGLTLISAWIINHIPVKCRVKLLKHSQTSMVYGVTIEGLEWIITFIPHIIGVIIHFIRRSWYTAVWCASGDGQPADDSSYWFVGYSITAKRWGVIQCRVYDIRSNML